MPCWVEVSADACHASRFTRLLSQVSAAVRIRPYASDCMVSRQHFRQEPYAVILHLLTRVGAMDIYRPYRDHNLDAHDVPVAKNWRAENVSCR
jgi:hypothetical protein